MTDPRFKFVGICDCGGGRMRKYKYGSWMVYEGSKSFKVKKNGATVKTGPINDLEKYLSQAIPAVATG